MEKEKYTEREVERVMTNRESGGKMRDRKSVKAKERLSDKSWKKKEMGESERKWEREMKRESERQKRREREEKWRERRKKERVGGRQGEGDGCKQQLCVCLPAEAGDDGVN